ncbi:MAG: selenocysteine-specific translation elongation factor [bacterium]|nr:selenocysteine-specific translation elongation factor [bacterium]MDY4101222.1 selenocysteine-specific translation elongation factor [Lachnospiraceae bacterium]
MQPVILGTAGHIDHGKTQLIKALTGRDTDTMKEEKQRGITIDLGFTYFDLPDGARAGVIDVPGHEKFLPNMVAGVCGMDLVLLTIAMDEGIMPQTREHVNILDALQVPAGIVVLTKYDMVELEEAERIAQGIQAELKGTVCHEWPFIMVSSLTGYGLDVLKQEIAKRAKTLIRNRNVSGRFRLPVDRVLSPKGIGTVVAGTLLSGHIHVNDPVELYPSGIRTRVKSVQVHGASAEEGVAGQRVAILLSGVDKDQVKRGDVAAYPESLTPTDRLDVRLTIFRDCGRVIKNQSRVHLHIGTAETICRVILMSKEELHAGESDYAQLVCEHPLTAKKKDCFVIRFLSPLESVGGGSVINEFPGKHKRKTETVLAEFSDEEHDQTPELVMRWLEKHEHRPVRAEEFVDTHRLQDEKILETLSEMTSRQQFAVLHGKKNSYYWTFEAEDEKWQEVLHALNDFHGQHPFLQGAPRLYLKNRCFATWDAPRVDAYLDFLVCEGRIVEVWNKPEQNGQEMDACCRAEQSEAVYAKSDFTVVPDDKMKRFTSRILKALQRNGVNLVPIGTLMTKATAKEEFEDRIAYLVSIGKLIPVEGEYYTAPLVAKEIREKLAEYGKEHEKITFAGLRDLMGTTRRSAKPFMAWLDREGLTRQSGSRRQRCDPLRYARSWGRSHF